MCVQPCNKVVTRLLQGCHKVVTTLSQPCHNLVTTLSTTLLQPCYNLLTRLLQPCNNLVTRLLQFQIQGFHNLVTRLSQPCDKVVTTIWYNLVTTLSQPCHNLVISVWVAASPDDRVTDPDDLQPLGLVEYKNSFAARQLTLSEACDISTFCSKKKDTDSKITYKLKQQHNYYYISNIMPTLL